jgi:hypothetical protein
MNSYSMQMWLSANLSPAICAVGFGLIAAGSIALIVLAVTWSAVRFVDSDE